MCFSKIKLSRFVTRKLIPVIGIYLLGLFIIYYTLYILLPLNQPNAHLFIPSYLHRYLKYDEEEVTFKTDSKLKLNKLKKKLEFINEHRETSNWRSYGPVLAQTPTLVVQVGGEGGAERRVRYLVAALAQVHGIHTALLVVSHARYRPALHRLLASIDYCQVMQIYYPYSVQLYPDRFPGPHPTDCKDIDTEYKAVSVCLNRNALLVEHKQHWWWKAKFVFEELEWSSSHEAPVIFLEDHHYVSPDILFVLPYAQRALDDFPEAEFITFGARSSDNVKRNHNMLIVDFWKPQHDKSIAFNTTTWKKMKDMAVLYCLYDDHRWSYSLWNMFSKFPGGPARAVSFVQPRVLSTLGHGSAASGAEAAWRTLQRAALYPTDVQVGSRYQLVARGRRTPPQTAGGWSDPRDQLLCIGSVITNTTVGTA